MYSVLTPSFFVAARSWAAKSSLPTQPTYTVDLGGNKYYYKLFAREWEKGGKDLSSTDGVLGCTASEVVDFVVLDQVLVKGHMFFFCEDCIVCFDIVPWLLV